MSRINWLPVLLLFACLLSACKQDDPNPTQLINNADLEQTPSDWSFGYYYNLTANPNKYKSAYTTEAAASGAHAFKIQCDTIRNDTTFCFFFKKLTAPAIPMGAKLTLKAKIKTVNLQGRGVSLGMIGFQSFRNEVKTVFFPTTEKTPITGTSDFKEYVVTLDSYPGDIDIIQIMLSYLPKTTGVVYFDDITLTVN